MSVCSGLLEVLACPKCKHPVEFDVEFDSIVCTACRLRYPVRNDIPVMLIDEAESY